VGFADETSLLPADVRQRVARMYEFVALYTEIEAKLTRAFSFE